MLLTKFSSVVIICVALHMVLVNAKPFEVDQPTTNGNDEGPAANEISKASGDNTGNSNPPTGTSTSTTSTPESNGTPSSSFLDAFESVFRKVRVH